MPGPPYIDLTAGAPPADSTWVEWAARGNRRRPDPGDGFRPLFDGGGLAHWQVAGGGRFAAVGDRIESVPGDGPGLFWCTIPLPRAFRLRLEWLRWRQEDRSAVLLCVPPPCAGPDGHQAFPASEGGFEVPFDDVGLPGAGATGRSGAIVAPRTRSLPAPVARPPAEWNELEITVRGRRCAVRLNGAPARGFDIAAAVRGRSASPATPRHIGLLLYPGSRVAVRRIGIRTL